jgi:SAM-dependent methyltransferase
VEQARQASELQPDYPLASIQVGDSRRLDHQEGTVDAVLLFGPLYHLTEYKDRLQTLAETKRVLKPEGVAFAVGISRFASTLAGLSRGFMSDPEFAAISGQDLADGQHRNPSGHAHYFTTAFFHLPYQLKDEVEAAGLDFEHILAIEGPGWLLPNFEDNWQDLGARHRLLTTLRGLESEPTLLGVSAHFMVIGRKRDS